MPPEAIIEWTAITACALYGVLAARRADLDLVGTFATTFLTALGGGTVRDLLLDRRVFWLDGSAHVLVVLAVAVLGSLAPRLIERNSRVLAIPDAIGLGMFAILGSRLASESGCPIAVAALLGVITGTCGGILADIGCGEVPRIFRPGAPLYATCALAGALLYLGLRAARVPEFAAGLSGASLTAVTRFIAWKLNLPLPDFDRLSERGRD